MQQQRAYRLIVNGSPLPLYRDPVAMMKLALDGPSALPGATVRYAPASNWLLEIETADGQIVYQDPKLELASRTS